MLDKLNEIEQRLAQVEQQLSDPTVYSDQPRLRDLSRQQKELTPVVEAYRAYRDAEQRMADATELLADPELKALAQKARFSQHTLTEDELTTLQTAAETRIALLQTHPTWKRLWYRYGTVLF